MLKKHKNVAILFADVSGSTKLFEIVGDDRARRAIALVLEVLSEITKRHEGIVIKTIGDEIMCTFPTASAAGNAAWEMQETLEEDNPAAEELDGSPLRIRVGFHYGSVILEKGDVFGDAVNVAARMAAQAKGGQIITTESTVDGFDSVLKTSVRFVDNAPVKGKQEVIKIYELIWQQEDVTRMAVGIETMHSPVGSKLILIYHEKKVELSTAKPSLVMGRSMACDLYVAEKMASRQHMRIELRRDKFFIMDQSTNGTYVQMDASGESFLRREEVQIISNGRVSLGRAFAQNPTEAVVFILS